MKDFIVSYITLSGVIVLNAIVKAPSRANAIDEVAAYGVQVVLSCVSKD